MPLTRRQTEVLKLMAEGAGSQEIADTLFISLLTVKHHISDIFQGLGVNSRVQAVLWYHDKPIEFARE